MHGIVDLEPPVYSSIDVDDSAPLHRRGLIRRPLTQNPSSSPSTWAHGLVRRPLTRAPSPSLSSWACRLSPPSSSTWARPPSVDAGSLVCRPLTRAPSPSSPSWACLRSFHRHGLVFALSVVMGLSFAPLHRHGLVFALPIDVGSFATSSGVVGSSATAMHHPDPASSESERHVFDRAHSAVVPLTCPKAVDLSDVRRPSCR